MTYICNRCLECRKRYASNWSFRLMQEEKVSSSAYFITLTYGENVRLTRNNFMTLYKRDVQLFFKRLRKIHSKHGVEGLKYYAVGEYGGKFHRPHYHVILFNADLSLMISEKDKLVLEFTDYDGKTPVSCFQWWDEISGDPLGHMTVGTVGEASVGYTMKYVCKPKWKRWHVNDDRNPEFSLMSKGLGISYLTEEMCEWHIADLENRAYVSLKDGKKASLPRYYKEKMYYEDEKRDIARVSERRAHDETARIIEVQTVAQRHAYSEYLKASNEKLLRYALQGREENF